AFLLGSVGIGITRSARYYPLVTAVSAAVNIGANLLLIPRFGPLGAAWATVASYAAMAGFGIFLSQRLWPVPFEWGRLGRLVAIAGGVLGVGWAAPAALLPGLVWKGVGLLSGLGLGALALRPAQRT
ncbi:MAG: polysaccharide biosynthesis C-terminal domain-containing protein, partial [Vicinamibacteria bacterium]|nr:polysaccharide biosynthesis C-terminal domain-containing protein [Vicinamibacteria bacterium]